MPSNQSSAQTTGRRPSANICTARNGERVTGSWRRKPSRHDVIPCLPSPRHKHSPRRMVGPLGVPSIPGSAKEQASREAQGAAFQVHATSKYLKCEKTNYVQGIPCSIAAVDLGVHRGTGRVSLLQAVSAPETPRPALGRSHLPRDNVAKPRRKSGKSRGGLISVLGNWPLGAVVTDKDGPIPAPG